MTANFSHRRRGPSRFSEVVRIDDALKYAAAMLKSEAAWATDSICSSMCEADHELETYAISEAVELVMELAERLPNPGLYSNGRMVRSVAVIEKGVVTSHVWHPDPAREEPSTWSGTLMHDPDTPCPGVFMVTTDPATQGIDVKAFRDEPPVSV